MSSNSTPHFRFIGLAAVAGFAALLLILGGWGSRRATAEPAAPLGSTPVPPHFAPVSLGAGPVTYSSPTLADLNSDNKLDIVVGTSDGHLVAVNGANGSILWNKTVLNFGFQRAGCGSTGTINSSPAVGLLRPAGGGGAVLGVVVGVGGTLSTNGNGGVAAFSANGNHLWTKLTSDTDQTPGTCTAGVWASPTIADMDKDGDNEVLFGAFDTKFYILNDNGSNYPGWPDIHGDFTDTHWSSPAVGDLDRDGVLEIVVASDEGKLNVGCPYPLDWSHDYCGGTVYAMHLNGTWLPGFPYFTWQAIQSAPALADLNQDGYLDIIFGTGTYYPADTAASNYDTFKVFAINYLGQNLPGWPVNLQGATWSAPAVGDIDGDGQLEVVIGTTDVYCFSAQCGGTRTGAKPNRLFALNHNGTLRWEASPSHSLGSYLGSPQRAPIIADYDNDGALEVIYTVVWEVQVRNGTTGALEIGGGFPPPSNYLLMQSEHILLNAPAVGDLDNDSRLEIVAAGARSGGSVGGVFAWAPPVTAGSPARPWPMFRRNAEHTARFALPVMQGGPPSIVQLHEQGASQTYTYVFPIQNLGDESMTLTTSDTSNKIDVSPASTSIGPGQAKNVTVILSQLNSYGNGSHNVGTITLEGTYGSGSQAANSPKNIPVTVIVANTIYRAYLPIVRK